MDNLKYYNDSLAYDFEMFMPRSAEPIRKDNIVKLPQSKVQKRDSGKTCSLCGLTFSDILSLGKVGCPDCYNTFRQELRDTIRSIHGTAKHVGLTPERSTAITPEPQKEPSEEEMLRTALEAAIRDENYEEAARLRDRIKALKGEN